MTEICYLLLQLISPNTEQLQAMFQGPMGTLWVFMLFLSTRTLLAWSTGELPHSRQAKGQEAEPWGNFSGELVANCRNNTWEFCGTELILLHIFGFPQDNYVAGVSALCATSCLWSLMSARCCSPAGQALEESPCLFVSNKRAQPVASWLVALKMW